LAARLNSQLGRLESAHANARVALMHASLLNRQEPVSEKNRGAYDVVIRNAVLAAADVYLLDGRIDEIPRVVGGDVQSEVGAWLSDPKHWHLPDLSGDASCRVQVLVARLLGGDRAAEQELLDLALGDSQRLNAGLLSVVAPKLVQASLLREEDAEASDRFDDLLQVLRDWGVPARLEYPLRILEMELAIRGVRPIDDELLQRARESFDGLLRAWRESPRLPGGTGFLHADDRCTTLTNYLRLLAASTPGQGGLRQVFGSLLEAHAAAAGERAPDVEQVLSALVTESHGLLFLLPGRLQSSVFVAEAGGFRMASAPDVLTLRPKAERLHRLLSRDGSGSDSEPWARMARDLSEALLPESIRERVLEWDRLSVYGAGMLLNLPFEFLGVPAEEGERRLGDVLAIDYASNLIDALSTPQRRAPRRLALAASLQTERDGLAQVRVDEPSLREFEGHYDRADVLLDEDVSVAAVIESLVQAGVGHLIGHGFQNPASYYPTGILFNDGDGGGFWGDRAKTIDAAGLVVILGSCGAGNAPYRRGGEPLAASLGGALLEAGARCVIVPMSDIRFGNHVAVMRILHELLASGRVPSEAMLEVRRRLSAAGNMAAWREAMLMQVHGRGF
ncbi:MAG: CHAT domain-containing protein, partial [Planctomycetota bacterium]